MAAISPMMIGAIAVLVILVFMSAMFSATETAFTSASRIKFKKMAEEGNKKAAKADRLLDNYERLLTTILVGNNLVNILASSISTFLFTEIYGPSGVAYATVIMLVVILICGEITPKCMAKADPEFFALKMTTIIGGIIFVLRPVTWIFEKMSQKITGAVIKKTGETPTLTEDELVIMVDEIEEEGELEKAESDLIKSAIVFDDKFVDEILTPRVDVVGIDKNSTMEEAKAKFIESGYSRLPVYEDTIDRIIGVIYSKDFYTRYFKTGGDAAITPIMRKVRFVPETATLAVALDEIQKSTVQMLVVVDDYGGTIGIVALEDILEELVGEIWDECDEVQYDIVKDDDGSYNVTGDANIHDLMDELGTKFDVCEYDGSNLGGYIQCRLQKPPIAGDCLTEGRVSFTVTSVRNKRVKLVKVTVDPEEETEDKN